MNIQSANAAQAGGVVVQRQPAPEGTTVALGTQLAIVPGETAQSTQDIPVSRQQLDQAVKAVSDFVRVSNSALQFSVDEDSGKTIVKVIDIATNDVIRQMPSKEMLAIAKALDSIKGLLVQQKV